MATSIRPPNAIGAPMVTPNAIQSSWATKEDWIKHQALIGQLYRMQPLAKVMDFMASQHGFRATEKMYKTRIKQWGFDKKNKENEMRAIVRKKKQLGNQGKPTTFRVRGRPVEFKDVVRYWARKGVRIDDVIAQRSKSTTPEAVDCVIFSASPTMTPEPMTNLEHILVSIRDYYKGSFETGTWVATKLQIGCETTKGPENALGLLYVLSDETRKACVLFARKRFNEAGQSLISATSGIKRIVLAEHPMTLTYVFLILAVLCQQKRVEVALAILRQFSALAMILEGERYPLCFICGLLASIHPSQLEEVIVICSGSLGDHFETLVGPGNRFTLQSRLEFVQEIDVENDMSHNVFLLQDLLHNYEATLGSLDVRTFYICLELAWHYLTKMEYVEAVRLGWDIVAHAQHPELSTNGIYFRTEALYILAASQYAMGETYSEDYISAKLSTYISWNRAHTTIEQNNCF